MIRSSNFNSNTNISSLLDDERRLFSSFKNWSILGPVNSIQSSTQSWQPVRVYSFYQFYSSETDQESHALVDYKNNRTLLFFNNFTPKRHRVSTVNYDSVTRGKAPSSFCFPQPHTCMQPQLYKDSIRARITEQFLRSVIRWIARVLLFEKKRSESRGCRK